MVSDAVWRELLDERYGPKPLREVRRVPAAFAEPGSNDGGPDTDIAIALRRRVLNEALEDAPERQVVGRRVRRTA